jgi:hypothetical protein
MEYTKPEVLVLGQAIDAVQSVGKPGGNLDSLIEYSSSAYESDE